MKKEIQVRSDDIERGIPRNTEACPIALAAIRTGYGYACIGGNTLRTMWVIYELPRSARLFIERFDNGKPVKPFAFFLDDAKSERC